MLVRRAAPAFEVRFSPDSRTLAVSDVGDGVSLWSPRSGRRLRTVRIPDNGSSLAWSPDGQQLAVAPFDAHVAVWNVRTGAVVRIPSEGHAWVRGASFSPDGRVLAFAMEHQGIRLHRLSDGAGLTSRAVEPIPPRSRRSSGDLPSRSPRAMEPRLALDRSQARHAASMLRVLPTSGGRSAS